MTIPASGTPAHSANYLLRRRTLSSGSTRGTPNYHSAKDQLPAWTQALPASAIVGVYENVRGSSSNALAFYNDALLILDEAGHPRERLVYYDIESFNRFCKEPVDEWLTVNRKDGTSVTFDVKGELGEVALLASFISNAIRLVNIRQNRDCQ
ncbi:MAG: hypothetical protein HC927_02000 [Deltaproteobacteria bacterium]|nr:hypothetical protein [Deltaproteobacteria bacterium]